MKKAQSLLLVFLLLLASVCYSQTSKEYSDRAMVRYLNKDYYGAIADYSEAIKLDPLNAETYCCRGAAKNLLKDYDGAISDYTQAITYDPKAATAYYLRGNAKDKIKDYDGAIYDYTKAIVYDPKDAIAYYKRGLSKHILGLKEGGCLDLSKAGELGYEKANEAIKQYCQNLPQEYVRSFKANDKTFDIPENEANDFLKDFPHALEIKSFKVGKDKYDIPISEVDKFMVAAPKAKPIHNYRQVLPSWDETTEIIDKGNSSGTGKKSLTQQKGNNSNFKLYNHLIDSRRVTVDELGDFETFNTLLSDPINATKLHENLIKKGFSEDEIGNRSDFLANIDQSVYSSEPKWEDGIDIVATSEAKPMQNNRLISYLEKLHENLSKRKGFTVPLDQFKLDMQDETNLKKLHENLSKEPGFKVPYDKFKSDMLQVPYNKATSQTDTLNLHFQIDKIKVGDTFVDLPIPTGFVKVDATMGILLESAKKLCPNTNTLLSYYISEEDYADYLVNQNHPIEKYIIVEVFNDFKNIQIGRKDYRQFIEGFKKKYVEESKQIYDEVGVKVSENLSNLDERIKMKNFKMHPLGICYESKNTISYGVLSKYNFSVENESSEDYIVAAISTITKVNDKPIFLFIYKIYNRSEDIASLKTINLAWIKKIEKNQSPVSFLADIDFEDYKEAILAILTLSFIWAIYFATKKIRRKLKTEHVLEKPEIEVIEDTNDLVDFDELLSVEKTSIEPISKEPETIQENPQIINPGLLTVSRRLRLIHAVIDMIMVYIAAYYIGYGSGFYFGYLNVGNLIGEHPYLFGSIITFITYFTQEFIFGRTLGKLITGTHVVNILGNKPTIWQLIRRSASRLIPFEAFSFLANDKRGWHDTISDTYVIKD